MNNAPFTADLPFDLMYQASRKEASRKKPVFFIHKYFARRITANFRMSLLAYLSGEEDDMLKKLYSNSRAINCENITVFDPFMGGGTTVFESLRFGCKTIGNDLQPLSYFVTKALVERLDEKKVAKEVKRLEKTVGEQIKSYYKTKCPVCEQEADSMYAFHVKKVKASTGCHEHRFFSSFIIAYRNDEFTVVCPKCGQLHKTQFEGGKFTCECGWTLLSPKDSYINRGVFECQDCNEKTVLSDYVGQGDYPFSTAIVAIEYCCPQCGVHDYKAPDVQDLELYQQACDEYEKIKDTLPIPQQDIPVGYNTNQIRNHGYNKFSDLFNKRQLLTLGLLMNEINHLEDKKVQFWLQLAFSGMLEMNNMFCRYQQNAYKICNIFFNHAYVPISMPVENCVWGAKLGTGTFEKTVSKIFRGKKFNGDIYDISVVPNKSGKYDSKQISNGDYVFADCVTNFEDLDGEHPLITCKDSRDLSHIPDSSVDIVLTDPPYGANIMYSELIDFFHCWNYMSSIAHELGFTTPLSPKSEEIIVNSIAGKDFEYYQTGITDVLKQCYMKVKHNGYLVFSFHDKSLEVWLSILRSIYSSGFKLIQCYPMQSETRTGAHTSNKNSIGIDIMLVCQKQEEIQAKPCNTITESEMVALLKETTEKTALILKRFDAVKAEITLPDVENIVIGIFFSNCKNYEIFDEHIIMSLKDYLGRIDDQFEDICLTGKRKGWWSELYESKWNITPN